MILNLVFILQKVVKTNILIEFSIQYCNSRLFNVEENSVYISSCFSIYCFISLYTSGVEKQPTY